MMQMPPNKLIKKSSFNQDWVSSNSRSHASIVIIILIIKLKLIKTMPVLFTITKASVDLYKII